MSAPPHPAAPLPPPARRWRPPLLLYGTAACHLLAGAAWLAQPALWPLWLAVLAANHLLIFILVLLPRNALLGENLRRLPPACAADNAVALTFDDGPDPLVTPQVLAILAQYQARASFFCIGQKVLQHPQLARAIIDSGHTIENHGHRHAHSFAFWGVRALRHDVSVASETIFASCGHWPRFFRAPAGFRNPLLDYVLATLGLHLASWTRRGFDSRCANADLVLKRLLRNLKAGDLLLLHDGNSARNAAGAAVVLTVLPRLLDALQAQGLRAVPITRAAPC